MKKVILLLVVAAFMTGCSLTPKVKQIEVTSKVEEKLPLNISTPPALELQHVDWIIVTEENIGEVWQLLKDDKEGVALFALRKGDYERLAINIKEIRALLGEYIVIVDAYKDYYEEK